MFYRLMEKISNVCTSAFDSRRKYSLAAHEGTDEQMRVRQSPPQSGQFTQSAVSLGKRAHQIRLKG